MNDPATAKTCPECGGTIPLDAPQGLCPKCILAGVAAPGTGEPMVDPADLPNLGAVRAAFPQLEVKELIGRGGMGFVYRARQPHLDRFVALKLLWPKLATDPAFAERFNREARVLARLNHPNIVAVYDFGFSGGFFYLLMEYVAGVNLRQAMAARRLAPSQALALVSRICEALEFAHQEGVLHRDIKPENLLLDTKGRLKIADFGIAKMVGERQKGATLTATGTVMGTPHYMAPEQIERPQEVDQRADIYSLGVVFYEMLTGELPIGRFAPPSKKVLVDVRLDEVVLKTLEKEPQRRYQQASEVKTDVESVASKGKGHARAGGWAFAGSSTHLVLCLLLSIVTFWFVLEFGPDTATMIQGPDIPLIELGRRWHLGNEVGSIFSAIAALSALLGAANFFAWRTYRLAQNHTRAVRTPNPPNGPAVVGPEGTVVVPKGNRSPEGAAEAETVADVAPATPPGEIPATWSGKAVVGASLAGVALFPPLLMVAIALFLALPIDHSFAAANLRTKFVFGTLLTLSPATMGTVFGWLALGDICRAAGRLRGRGPAYWAALFWPLLLLDTFCVGVLALGAGRFVVRWGGGLGSLLLVLPLVLLVLVALDYVVSAKAWRWVTRNDAFSLNGRRSPLPAAAALCAAVALGTAALVLAFPAWLPMLAKANPVSGEPEPIAESEHIRETTLQVMAPPRETLVVVGLVLSNGVPMSGPELRAKLWPPSGQKPSPFLLRWQTVQDAATGTPWEILIEDETSHTIAARLRPTDLPRLRWSPSPHLRTVEEVSASRQAQFVEVARALQTADTDKVSAVDWSVRLRIQSAPIQPTNSRRGIEAEFVLPPHQVAVFEVVTRSNRVISPVPQLAAYVVNGASEYYAGRFAWTDDPDDLDSLTGLPRWKFGIVGPDDRNLEEGVGVPSASSGYAGSTDLWIRLEPDSEIIHGLADSPPDRPAYGLRIRTQACTSPAGQTIRSVGRGTNWMASSVVP